MIIAVSIVVGALLGMWFANDKKAAGEMTGVEMAGETTGEKMEETGLGLLWTGLFIGMLAGGLVGLLLSYVDRHYLTINGTVKKRC